MDNKRDLQKKISIGLLVIYLMVLTWIIVFKMEFSIREIKGSRSINLIPFHESMIINSRLAVSEIVDNMLVFVPFGVYMSMINSKTCFWKKVIPIAGTSLIYEVLQFIFAIGASDITDLIGNTFGGIIGIGIYFIISKIFKNEMKINKVLNVLAIIGTILVIGMLGFLIIVNI